MYRVIETMTLKDGTHIDRVRRYDTLEGAHSAKSELWNFLYECTNDSNLAYAQATIMDDYGAVYKTDDYRAEITTEPEAAPETE